MIVLDWLSPSTYMFSFNRQTYTRGQYHYFIGRKIYLVIKEFIQDYWEQRLETHVSNSKMYSLYVSSVHVMLRKEPNLKIGKDLNGHFSKEDMQNGQ